MAEHIHGCMTCRPDMVPDFSKDDPRFHRKADKCETAFSVLLDGEIVKSGEDVVYTNGAFEGREGWGLYVGTIETIHDCPCGSGDQCVEPRFGRVEVQH